MRRNREQRGDFVAHRRRRTDALRGAEKTRGGTQRSAAQNAAETDGGNKTPNTGGRHGVAEKAIRALDLPADLFSGMLHIEMSGNREVVVDGCQGILIYNENLIKLNTGRCKLQLCGRGLCIRSLTRESVVISGFITSMEFAE